MSRSVTITDARVAYGESIVMEHLDLDIAPGEFVVLLGPSGCGKSTLLRAIGELRSIDGTITIGGEPPRTAWKHLAYVFQQPRLLMWKSAAANIVSAMRLRGAGHSKTDRSHMAQQQLDRVGLGDIASRKAHLLSGGEQQRVAIARALALQPDVLLMDEPFSALDVATRRSLRQQVVDIWKDAGVTVVFVTHDLDEALEIASRIVVFSSKPTRILADLSPPGEAPRTDASAELADLHARIAALFTDADDIIDEAVPGSLIGHHEES